MSGKVTANGRTVVHKKSGGTTVAFPNVRQTPCGSETVAVPYPSVGSSDHLSNEAKTVRAEGQAMGHESSFFSKTKGDDPETTHGKAEFINCSFDVTVEGKGVVRAFDQMIHDKNSPPTPLIQPSLAQHSKPENG